MVENDSLNKRVKLKKKNQSKTNVFLLYILIYTVLKENRSFWTDFFSFYLYL